MIKPEMVPREATEAAAVQLSNGKNTTQAIAAAINAWPGAHLVGDMGIYLPLHTENPNAES